jgi:hypothetical protein
MKKHRTTVAGTDLFSMFTSAMSKVDPTTNSIATLMQQCTQFLELAEQRHREAEERAHHTEEPSQHLKLIQLLHSGKIDQATYDELKPQHQRFNYISFIVIYYVYKYLDHLHLLYSL